jgi:hypothetical protein
MESLKGAARKALDRAGLRKRIAVLEAEVQECRQLNLRLAELCDVMMELLVPAADRDERRIAEVIERYQADVGDPHGWSAGSQRPR